MVAYCSNAGRANVGGWVARGGVVDVGGGVVALGAVVGAVDVGGGIVVAMSVGEEVARGGGGGVVCGDDGGIVGGEETGAKVEGDAEVGEGVGDDIGDGVATTVSSSSKNWTFSKVKNAESVVFKYPMKAGTYSGS
mmetsp:Transcript_12300/g.26806  ORF Transcript_12300/g.26806 Transcript_12300/m.26806 type:complete len:136 (-) Transcript_12300:96-503(-)